MKRTVAFKGCLCVCHHQQERETEKVDVGLVDMVPLDIGFAPLDGFG